MELMFILKLITCRYLERKKSLTREHVKDIESAEGIQSYTVLRKGYIREVRL
jgi:hypothetical protein